MRKQISVWLVLAVGCFKLYMASAAIKFSDQFKMPEVRVRRSVAMSAEEKKAIVDKHNELRGKEGSSNMVKMKWNNYLADMATKWAEKCRNTHGFPQDMVANAPYRGIGQNLYLSLYRRTDNSSVRATQKWYDEKPDFNFQAAVCTPGKKCGHYTQVVWAATSSVGCGYRVCPYVEPNKWQDAYFLVCNYGPAGNYRGQYPYTKGQACSSCPETAKFCDKGLCSGSPPVEDAAPSTKKPSSGASSMLRACTNWTFLLFILFFALSRST